MSKKQGPHILLFDIETAPIVSYTWGIWDVNITSNQILEDWCILSWSAKWLGKKEIMYMDNRNKKNLRDDKRILQGLIKLLNKADIVITHNGKKFDEKKVKTRITINKLEQFSSFKHIDTLRIAKKHFAFTSNKLEDLARMLGVEHQKLKHDKFPGQLLWNECLKGNVKAWEEMEKYNKQDVLVLEDVYNVLSPWDKTINFNIYRDGLNICNCGSSKVSNNGYNYTEFGKFQRYRCKNCGAEVKSKENLLSKEKKQSLQPRLDRKG